MLAWGLQAAQGMNHFADFFVDGQCVSAGRRPCKRRTHHHHRMKHIGARQRTPSGHGRAKVVANDAGHRFVPKGMDQCHRVRHQLQHVAGLPVAIKTVVPARGAAIAALIGGHHMVASSCQHRQLVPPTERQFWKAMQQKQQRLVCHVPFMARFQEMHTQALIGINMARAHTLGQGQGWE